jgi:hypothetical protein
MVCNYWYIPGSPNEIRLAFLDHRVQRLLDRYITTSEIDGQPARVFSVHKFRQDLRDVLSLHPEQDVIISIPSAPLFIFSGTHGDHGREMCPAHRNFACARFTREPARTEDRPFEFIALNQVLVRLVLPLHPG